MGSCVDIFPKTRDISIVTMNGSKERQGFNTGSISDFQTTVFVVDFHLNQIKGGNRPQQHTLLSVEAFFTDKN